MDRRSVLVALIAAGAALSAPACSPDEPTPNGTKLVAWTRAPITWDSGISTGDDLGPHAAFDKSVSFTPNDRTSISLDDARFTIHVEHGDIALKSGRTPAPADKAKSPRKIEITVVDNGGWRTTADCSADLSHPALDDLGVVTLMQRCEITLVNGDDTGRVSLDIYGDGRAAALGGFGRAELH